MKDPIRKTAEEAYAFVCLSCGYGWEQSYLVEHHLDERGRPFVQHYTDGRPVHSPLAEPVCDSCEGHRVRVMRAGLVDAVARAQPVRTDRPVT
ncbi:hypothetical protein PJ985_06755 [Streptomyces sp. ACA25]|uniref:hypothetical protein n=1 Tax=Streptomyces sp. ACA25 TaxID=3022596 RepID=UPI002307D751|nr:hypothetical protein [Streptomyces sp. ACA25]MDB1087266.1 hypothetical protein [Streptomyces sp. ACA25]